MTRYEAGDVVLVRYPFTDLTTTKKRPAIVLNSSEYSDRFLDIVLMPLTSRQEPEAALALRQWKSAGLPKPTWVKPVIGTLTSKLIERQLGVLHEADESAILAALRMTVAERWWRPLTA
jgi:mRNA interferase MazF